ncbi:MAG TPA: hypothetical protein VK961_26920 [Chthoniobacter sp.]|nr:hypothetical protein [Chthoniobacter sp.]
MISAKLIVTDLARPRLAEIAEEVKNPVALYKDCGRRLVNELRTWFTGRDAEDSPKHPNSTHFWADVRGSVQNPVSVPNGVTVEILDPRFAQKVFGGTITAKNVDALTVPISPLAHGRRASVFEEETGYRLFRPKGHNVLDAIIGGEVVPIYALVKSVTQSADPNALPPDAQLEAAVLDTAEKHLARQVDQANR